MRIRQLGLLSLAAVAITISAANVSAAEKVEVKANSGLTAIFSFFRTYENSCDSAPPPRFKIKQQASHGRIVVEIIKSRFGATAKRCAGKPAHGLVVGYRPDRGYRGRDSAAITLRYSRYSNASFEARRTVRFDISVR